jgi:hypothetical protein
MQIAQGKQVKSFNMNEIGVLPPVEPKEGDSEVRLYRTNEDKRRAVVKFFEDFPHDNQRQISAHEIWRCAVRWLRAIRRFHTL